MECLVTSTSVTNSVNQIKKEMLVYSEEQWISWMDKLASDNVVIADKFISDELFAVIMKFFRNLEENEQLRTAGIGSKTEFQIKTTVRGDLIYWLEKERDVELEAFFDLMDELVLNLKRYCFLSLSGSEFHLAKYPEGAHYERHVDEFSGRNNRQITVLIYLNEHWKNGDGGELRIFDESGDVLVHPLAQRLVLFKSDVVEHEVLVTNVPRYSLTGWLLHQPSALGYILN